MSTQPKKRVKYSIHLAAKAVTTLEGFLTANALAKCEELPAASPPKFPMKLFYETTAPKPPQWARLLGNYFKTDGKIVSSSAGAVLLFECEKRVMACAYGFGHVLLDDEKRENDFGLIIAANALSDENVKLVEKANLGSVIRDATQAAGITRLQEFNVDRALSLVRRLSGSSAAVGSSLIGANSITLTSEYEPTELHSLGKNLLELYQSKAYQKTGFGIIDKIKPIHDAVLVNDLDNLLLADLQTTTPSFELGIPELDTQPSGRITISGAPKRTSFADLDLRTAIDEIGPITTPVQLHDHQVVVHNIDDTGVLKRWSIYRGLVGSVEKDGKRYALNEGTWYRVDLALISAANSTFKKLSVGLDKTYPAWPIIGIHKKKNKVIYQREFDYNTTQCTPTSGLLLFDTSFFKVPTNPGPGIEVCDIFDVKSKKLIHVKRSGRRSSVISHFLNQGAISARLLKTYPTIRDEFLAEIGKHVSPAEAKDLLDRFPQDWSVEYKFADKENSKGEYTIPFFSRVALDEVRREIEALGFKEVIVSFIRLSKDPKTK